MRRHPVWRSVPALLFVAALTQGCASVDLRSGFADVASMVETRSGLGLYWNSDSDLDRQAVEKIDALLRGRLSAASAAQIALLNNREIQAVYAGLGVAQADLVQAGLLKNPIFDASMKLPLRGAKPDFELTAVMSFLDIVFVPLRRRVAEARFQEAKNRVTVSVLDMAGRTRSAFYRYVAAEQRLKLRHSIVESLSAAAEVMQRLLAAGNISELDGARQQVLLEHAKLQLRAGEAAVRQNREALNVLLGLWGTRAVWQSGGILPALPAEPVPLEPIEAMAVRRSLELEERRWRLVAAGEQVGLTRSASLLTDLHLGAGGERNDGAWEIGPVLEVPIPLFDRGEARVGRDRVELWRAQQDYHAVAVRVRGAARALAERLGAAREMALHVRDTLLPLHERIVAETQLHYNAMQVGPVELLRARERQIEAAEFYVDALLEYWLAHNGYAQLMAGGLPDSGGFSPVLVSRPASTMANGGH